MKLRRFAFNKLVRDKTEERMNAKQCTIYNSTLTEKEYIHELIKKLQEEADEVITAPADKEAEELGDLLEVVHALSAVYNVSMQAVEDERRKTFKARGGFAKRLFVAYADVPEDSPAYNYYIENQDRYPEISIE